MNDQKEEAKIAKCAEKKKSGPIIKLMAKADNEVLVKALGALGQIGDEDSANNITHYLDHSDKAVRLAAVSYTHLDVYKRQATRESMFGALMMSALKPF